MGNTCYTLSSKEGHILQCEEDANGECTKNCKHVPITAFSKDFAREIRRFKNAIKKYGKQN